MYLTYVGSQNDVVPLRTEKLAAHKDLVGRYFRGLINKPTGSQTFRKLCGLKWESNIWRPCLDNFDEIKTAGVGAGLGNVLYG